MTNPEIITLGKRTEKERIAYLFGLYFTDKINLNNLLLQLKIMEI